MNTNISSLIEAAHRGDWQPLIEESKKAPGKHWAEFARCANQDINMFVPLADGPREDPDLVKAKLGISLNRPRNLCASCPLAVAARCLVESLTDDDEYGIRAGLLASERSELRRAWQDRDTEKSVEDALRGCTATLTKPAREAVIARFATDPSLDAAAVARGLGVTHEYLLKLARRYRKSQVGQAPPAPRPSRLTPLPKKRFFRTADPAFTGVLLMLQNSPSEFHRTNIGGEIREIAPTAVLVRVYPVSRSVTHVFESDFYRMLIDRRTEEELARMVRRGFGSAADWRRAHDLYLPTETLYLTPEPHQNGYVPEDDQSFGLSLSRRIAIGGGEH